VSALSFTGHHVFVAGGSSGINLGIAQAFARAGARLSVISRSAERVERAAAGLRELGKDAIGIAADVRQPNAVELAFSKAVEKFGPTGVMVSGAPAIFWPRPWTCRQMPSRRW